MLSQNHGSCFKTINDRIDIIFFHVLTKYVNSYNTDGRRILQKKTKQKLTHVEKFSTAKVRALFAKSGIW